jgi:hypothetical protein
MDVMLQLSMPTPRPRLSMMVAEAELAFGVSELLFQNSEFQRCISVHWLFRTWNA